ncbi:transposase-like protein [Streptomyces sp. V4I8]
MEVISHCVWLYHRFSLSCRDVEELMRERGVEVSYESIRRWCVKFGQEYANRLGRRRPRPGGKWHMDEVFIKINGVLHYLWRAVDQAGNVLDILVTTKRDAKAAKRFFRRLLKELEYMPRVIVTDKLRSVSCWVAREGRMWLKLRCRLWLRRSGRPALRGALAAD